MPGKTDIDEIGRAGKTGAQNAQGPRTADERDSIEHVSLLWAQN